MKKSVKILSVVLALVIVIGCFAACGGNDTPDTPDVPVAKVKVIDIALTEELYAFGVDKNQPELLTKVNAFIDEIKKNGKFDAICEAYFGDGEKNGVVSAELDTSRPDEQLVVATNAAFEPFEYKVGDKFYGIDMEIAALLAEYLGQELVIRDMEFDAVCMTVGQHKCDIAMAGLTINEKRKEDVEFSTSYYTANQKLVVRGDDTTFDACKTLADVETILNGYDNAKKAGFQNGTTGNWYVVGDEDWGFDGLKVEPKGYSNGSLAIQDLINKNIDFVVIDADPATFITTAINEVA
ncbi:MAG: transporter substrate-binding domain-containing protein [Clostridia bacterium]|nr:transporter substrate-binding domain-containing protein [Clostridia bacterium]